MRHCDYVFDLISSKWNADCFENQKDAEQFARGIKESRVMSQDDYGKYWVVQVGPWMFARGIKKK